MAWQPLPGDRSSVRSLQESLEALHRVLGLARPDTLRLLEDAWVQLLGRHLAERAHLESLVDGRLTVAVEDPAIAEALRWQAGDLAAACNELCGGEVVTEVVTRIRRRSAGR
jgi:predicted nucleic acid-binding Zn ribbon protein